MANDLADSLLTDGPFAAAKEQIAARSDRFELLSSLGLIAARRRSSASS